MKDIKYLETFELPKGEEEFWLIRQDQDMDLILEFYQKKEDGDWDSECIHVFKEYTPYDKELVLKEAESFINEVNTLYIEEETFWDEA